MGRRKKNIFKEIEALEDKANMEEWNKIKNNIIIRGMHVVAVANGENEGVSKFLAKEMQINVKIA